MGLYFRYSRDEAWKSLFLLFGRILFIHGGHFLLIIYCRFLADVGGRIGIR